MAGDALELARILVDRWNAHDLEGVYATWDPDIVVQPDPYFPDSAVVVGPEAARRFWESQMESMGFGRLETSTSTTLRTAAGLSTDER